MKMLNKELFSKNMVAIGEMYGKKLSKEILRMYYMVLEDMTDEQFKQAVKVIMQTHVWSTLPKPAEFIQAVTPDNEAQVISAWDKVVNAMARVGGYETVVFDDPLIHGFIQGFEGGWPAICHTDFEALVWVKKEFERYYRAIKPENITCKPLIGITYSNHAKSGQEYNGKPVYIGDEGIGQALIEDGRKQESVIKELEG